MSVDDFLPTIAPEDLALKTMRDEAKRTGLDSLTMQDIDVEIAAYRSDTATTRPDWSLDP